MQFPWESRRDAWHEALWRRTSRRRFQARAIAPELLRPIERLCQEFRPFGSARAVLVARAPAGVFRGIMGSYGQVKDAPSCLLMVGSEDGAAQVGYVGEAAVLEATSQGLGTCWVAGLFDEAGAADLVDLAPGERVFAVSPLGHPVARKTLEERFMSGVARSSRRKGIEEIAPGIETGDWPAWVVQGVEAARTAPSAVNRQPWRFRLREGGVVVSVDSLKDTHRIPKRLDCGIAMLHFELGAARAGVPGRWSFLDPPQVAVFRPDVR